MNKTILITGALLGIIAVILGAFAAHGLKDVITSDALRSFETGVRYQIYHAFLLLILGGTSICDAKTKKRVYWAVLIGVVFFSGSIYGLSTNALTSFDFKTIALVTPLGGTILIISWLLMLINFLKMKLDN